MCRVLPVLWLIALAWALSLPQSLRVPFTAAQPNAIAQPERITGFRAEIVPTHNTGLPRPVSVDFDERHLAYRVFDVEIAYRPLPIPPTRVDIAFTEEVESQQFSSTAIRIQSSVPHSDFRSA